MTTYDAFAHTFSNSRKNLYWPELEYIQQDMKEKGYTSILDIGCGNGRFLEYMKQNAMSISQYLGTDSSAGMIDEARSIYPEHTFAVQDMQDIHTDGTYDAIVFLASFHHLDTLQSRVHTLQHIAKNLKKGGRIYLTNWYLRGQPRYDSACTRPGEYMIKIGAHSRYYHGFELLELEDIYTQCGYIVVENRVYDGGRNILSILERVYV